MRDRTIVRARTKKKDEESEIFERDHDFVQRGMKLWRVACDNEQKNRDNWMKDVKFSVGEGQWPEAVRTMRNNQQRPCLTINRTRQPIQLVANEQRHQRPAITVSPIGDGASKEVAEVFQGIIRHIDYISNADQCKDTAFDFALRGGWGYEGLSTDFVSPDSWDQEILNDFIDNPMMIYWDPASRLPDGSDAEDIFEIIDYSKEKYKSLFHSTALAKSLTEMSSIGDNIPDWLTKDNVRVARWWHVKKRQRTLNLWSDGVARFSDDPPPAQPDPAAEGEEQPEPIRVIKHRIVNERTVVCDTFNAKEVIKHEDWPGKWIPRFPVYGEKINIDGQVRISGMIRDMKEPAQAYNVWVSAATEVIAKAPKNQWVMAEGQDEGHAAEFANAAVSGINVLHYKPVQGPGGSLVPPPTQQPFDTSLLQTMRGMVQQSDADIQATSGVHDPSLGRDKRDQSGRAINALQQQSQIGNSNYSDNLMRTERHRGVALVDLIPHIYDAPRIARIINPDATTSMVGVYNSKKLIEGGHAADTASARQVAHDQLVPRILEAHPDMAKITDDEARQAAAIKKIYDLGTGQYDVAVTVGPSFVSKRQEAAASMLDYAKVDPQALPFIRDQLVRSQDWPGADAIADRLKKMLPPQLQQGEEGAPPTVEQLQAQMGQVNQQHDQLVAEVHKLSDIIKQKQIEQETTLKKTEMEVAGREKVAEIGTKAQEQRTRAEVDAELVSTIHDSAHERAMQVADQQHQQEMQAQGAEQDQAAQAQAAQQPQQDQGGPATPSPAQP